jgi:hypothetical protein
MISLLPKRREIAEGSAQKKGPLNRLPARPKVLGEFGMIGSSDRLANDAGS